MDRVFEFVDTPAEEPAALCADSAALGERSLLTDMVDRVVEFVDSAADETASGLTMEPSPVFIDEVDRIVEFLDEAAQETPGPEVPGALQPAKTVAASAGDPSPTNQATRP
ncbi:MAG TPA: hypothetical protein DDY78_07510 [Planctomycetales bacterium]|nr:hypothetical protein [Planctomycetales bacterium]